MIKYLIISLICIVSCDNVEEKEKVYLQYEEEYKVEYDIENHKLQYFKTVIIDNNIVEKDFNWNTYLSPWKNQPCRDCYIYAAIEAYETQYRIDHKDPLNTIDLSEQMIHDCTGLSCLNSGNPKTILEHIRDYGVLEEKYVPYVDGSLNECISLEYNNLPYYTLDSVEKFYDRNIDVELKRKKLVEKLQHGPLAILNDNWSFEKNEQDIYECNSDKQIGGHSNVIVGYENYGEYFIVKNSHGEDHLLKIRYEGSEKCGFAFSAIKINNTKVEYGYEKKYIENIKDYDKDGIIDIYDNCVGHSNIDQIDTDGDLIGDACDKCPENNDPRCQDISNYSWLLKK